MFSFVLIENRPYLNHSVFGEPRDNMHGMDRGLTTRAEIPLNFPWLLLRPLPLRLCGCVAMCAAAPRCERRRAWREDSRRVFTVSNRVFRPQNPLVGFLGISGGKLYI